MWLASRLRMDRSRAAFTACCAAAARETACCQPLGAAPTRRESPMLTSRLLWLLMSLFALRVLGQMLVEFCGVTFLPPSAEWFSGLIPYPSLLASQILILTAMTKINVDFSRQ